MAWPASAVATNDPVTALQCNSWYVKIAATTLAVDTATVVLSAIPQGFKHLIVMGALRCSTGLLAVSVDVRFNEITVSDTYPAPFGVNGTLTSVSIGSFIVPAATATANRFGTFRASIPNYADPVSVRSMLIASGYSAGTGSGSGSSDRSVMWRATGGPVTSITLSPASGSFKAGSIVTLYATGAR